MAKKGKRIGYACEWEQGPTLAEQAARLRDHGCWNIYEESLESRRGWPGNRLCGKQLSLALIDLRPGDHLVVLALQCIGRTSERLLHVLRTVQQAGAYLRVLNQGLDSEGPEGQQAISFVVGMWDAMLASKKQAIRDGLQAARERGRIGGRRPVLSDAKLTTAKELVASSQHTMREIAKLLGVSRGSLYNSGLGRRALGKSKGRSRGATLSAVTGDPAPDLLRRQG